MFLRSFNRSHTPWQPGLRTFGQSLTCFVLTLILSSPTPARAREDAPPSALRALTFEATYTGDQLNNLSGGIRSGSYYLGMASLSLRFSTEEAGLWKGGLVHLHAVNTHGATPSTQAFGDLQVVSNIEAGDHSYLQEWWFSQALGPWTVKAGMQDLNADFVHSRHADHLINSSFGMMPTLSTNFPAPIFPLTSLGVSVAWEPAPRWSLAGAFFDGVPNDFEESPHNLEIRLDPGREYLALMEARFHPNLAGMDGTWKAGWFRHKQEVLDGTSGGASQETTPTEAGVPNTVSQWGLYLLGDQIVWEHPEKSRSLGLFVHCGINPEMESDTHYYLGCGICLYGFLAKDGLDALSLAVAHAGRRVAPGSETTVELTYRREVSKNLYLQPDFQYIIQPAGSGTDIENSFVAGIRFGITL
jgi:porin